MQYKIEALYTYGWDDAEWSEETGGVTKPLRFQSVANAQKELDEFLADVRNAVAAGHTNAEENPNQYRIAEVTE